MVSRKEGKRKKKEKRIKKKEAQRLAKLKHNQVQSSGVAHEVPGGGHSISWIMQLGRHSGVRGGGREESFERFLLTSSLVSGLFQMAGSPCSGLWLGHSPRADPQLLQRQAASWAEWCSPTQADARSPLRSECNPHKMGRTRVSALLCYGYANH